MIFSKKKKILSAILSLAMIGSMAASVPFTASAAASFEDLTLVNSNAAAYKYDATNGNALATSLSGGTVSAPTAFAIHYTGSAKTINGNYLFSLPSSGDVSSLTYTYCTDSNYSNSISDVSNLALCAASFDATTKNQLNFKDGSTATLNSDSKTIALTTDDTKPNAGKSVKYVKVTEHFTSGTTADGYYALAFYCDSSSKTDITSISAEDANGAKSVVDGSTHTSSIYDATAADLSATSTNFYYKSGMNDLASSTKSVYINVSAPEIDLSVADSTTISKADISGVGSASVKIFAIDPTTAQLNATAPDANKMAGSDTTSNYLVVVTSEDGAHYGYYKVVVTFGSPSSSFKATYDASAVIGYTDPVTAPVDAASYSTDSANPTVLTVSLGKRSTGVAAPYVTTNFINPKNGSASVWTDGFGGSNAVTGNTTLSTNGETDLYVIYVTNKGVNYFVKIEFQSFTDDTVINGLSTANTGFKVSGSWPTTASGDSTAPTAVTVTAPSYSSAVTLTNAITTIGINSDGTRPTGSNLNIKYYTDSAFSTDAGSSLNFNQDDLTVASSKVAYIKIWNSATGKVAYYAVTFVRPTAGIVTAGPRSSSKYIVKNSSGNVLSAANNDTVNGSADAQSPTVVYVNYNADNLEADNISALTAINDALVFEDGTNPESAILVDSTNNPTLAKKASGSFVTDATVNVYALSNAGTKSYFEVVIHYNNSSNMQLTGITGATLTTTQVSSDTFATTAVVPVGTTLAASDFAVTESAQLSFYTNPTMKVANQIYPSSFNKYSATDGSVLYVKLTDGSAVATYVVTFKNPAVTPTKPTLSGDTTFTTSGGYYTAKVALTGTSSATTTPAYLIIATDDNGNVVYNTTAVASMGQVAIPSSYSFSTVYVYVVDGTTPYDYSAGATTLASSIYSLSK